MGGPPCRRDWHGPRQSTCVRHSRRHLGLPQATSTTGMPLPAVFTTRARRPHTAPAAGVHRLQCEDETRTLVPSLETGLKTSVTLVSSKNFDTRDEREAHLECHRVSSSGHTGIRLDCMVSFLPVSSCPPLQRRLVPSTRSRGEHDAFRASVRRPRAQTRFFRPDHVSDHFVYKR